MAVKRQIDVDDGETGGGDGSERLCAVTRERMSPDLMLRFALAPDATVVPDLERRLPGRGVWLTSTRETVDKAVKTKAFGRSFKAEAHAAADLGERIAAMLERRVLDSLALANKAGLVMCGFQQVDSALMAGDVAAVLHGSDAAADGRSKLDRKFKAIQRDCERDAPIVAALTIAQMSLALGRPSVVHAGLLRGGLTERFLREAERLERYRSNSAAPELAFSVSDNEG